MHYFKKAKNKAYSRLNRDRTKAPASESSTINSIAGPATAPNKLETPLQPQPVPQNPLPSIVGSAPAPSNPETQLPRPVPEKTPVFATLQNAAEAILNVATESADVFPPLKSVLGGLRAILALKEQYSGNKERVKAVIKRLEELEGLVTGDSSDASELERRGNLIKKFTPISKELDRILGQNIGERLANAAADEAAISSRVEVIRDALLDYQVSLQQELLRIALASIAEADWNKLERISRARKAEYSSEHHQKCMKGTRESVLQDIETWVGNTHHDRRVYWLNGHAGSGKSTIAQSFAELSFAQGRLGASFFCSRDVKDRSELKLIFPTLAFQLARKFESFRHHLFQNVVMLSDVTEGSLSHQLQELIIKPLKASGISTLIIIDALDECVDEESASVILSLLARYIDEIPLVKFFITGRPESRIRSGFRLPLLRAHTEVLLLHEVGRESVDDDIRTYLTTQLSKTVENRSDLDLTLPWPSASEIDILVRKAGGLFIFASTTLKFVSGQLGNPVKLLKLVVDSPYSSEHEASFVDPLYTAILKENYPHIQTKAPGVLEMSQASLGTVVLVFNPLCRTALAVLLNTTPGDVLTFLRPLHSLIRVPTSEYEPVTVFHKSFPDYITEATRCRNVDVYIDPLVHHANLATRCLETMVANLKRNPCNLPQHKLNADVSDLPERRKECIGDALEYACRFWASHLACSSTAPEYVQKVLPLLKQLFESKMLAWLEVLSLMNEARSALESFQAVKSWLLTVANPDSHLMELVLDSDRSVRHTFDVIRESASHIYDSALHWLPLTSLVRRKYSGELVNRFKLLNAVRESWDNCLMRFKPGDNIYAISYSHDGNLLACCGSDNSQQNFDEYKGFVKLYEAATGVCISTFTKKGDLWVGKDIAFTCCVDFSHDDALLASGSADSTITVWDVKMGREIRTLKGHTTVVYAVRFSPNGLQLASGSWDQSIWIWDVTSGVCMQTLEGHSGGVQSVAWSPSGDLLLSGSSDQTARLWEISTGNCQREITDHTDHVSCVSFSPDGSSMATSSFNKVIHIYDKNGDCIRTLMEESPIWCLCFSPDGGKIFCGTDAALSVWDTASGVRMSFFASGPVVALSLLPDMSCVASASNLSGYMSVWQLETMQNDDANSEEYGYHSEMVRQVSFAPSGKRFATVSMDDSVKLWDADSGSCLHTFGPLPTEARRIAFSSDSSTVAGGFEGSSIIVWDANTFKMIATLESAPYTTALRYSPNGLQFVALSYNGIMTVWDTTHWEKQMELDITDKGFVMDATDSGGLMIKPSNKPCEVPLWYLPDFDKWPERPFVYSYRSSWVTDGQGNRVLWIPADFRGVGDVYGTKFALGSNSGKVIVIEFLAV